MFNYKIYIYTANVLWSKHLQCRTSNHIRRFQEHFIHIHILICSITLQFLQFWYQNGVNIIFLMVKPKEVTSNFILKLMKKFARWLCCWNIWHFSLETKIYPILVRYQESNEYQKNHQDLRNSDLEVCCTNIQPKLKNLRCSTKNQSFLWFLEVFWSSFNIGWILN